MPSLLKALESGHVLVSDGAWGTFLQKKGLKPGDCPEQWCLDHPDDVRDIAAAYLAAGADMVETNSFGGSRFKLEHYGLAERTAEINEAAAALSRQAAGPDRIVLGSIGPTGKMILLGDVTPQDFYNAFREQARALEKGGADACCIETFSDIEEAVQAIRAVRENTRLEIICTFTFDEVRPGEFRTMMGVTPTQMAEAVLEAGADVIGTNCGNGMSKMPGIVAELRQAAPHTPILVHANAGSPVNINGVDTFPETPAEMAGHIPAVVDAGANIVGGCCGTTPDHIRAIREILEQQGRRPPLSHSNATH